MNNDVDILHGSPSCLTLAKNVYVKCTVPQTSHNAFYIKVLHDAHICCTKAKPDYSNSSSSNITRNNFPKNLKIVFHHMLIEHVLLVTLLIKRLYAYVCMNL